MSACVWLHVPGAFNFTGNQSHDPNVLTTLHVATLNFPFSFTLFLPSARAQSCKANPPAPAPEPESSVPRVPITRTFLPGIQGCWALRRPLWGVYPCLNVAPGALSLAGSAGPGVYHSFRHHEDILISLKRGGGAGFAPQLVRY